MSIDGELKIKGSASASMVSSSLSSLWWNVRLNVQALKDSDMLQKRENELKEGILRSKVIRSRGKSSV